MISEARRRTFLLKVSGPLSVSCVGGQCVVSGKAQKTQNALNTLRKSASAGN